MILYLIQLLVSLLGSIWLYFITDSIPFQYQIPLLIIIFIVINFIVFLLFILLYAIIVILNSETSGAKPWKRKILVEYCKYVFLYLFRVRMEVFGKENLPKNNNFVIYSNHSEFADSMYLIIALEKYPIAFLSKKTLFKVFLVRHALRFMGGIGISRKADRSVTESVQLAIETVKGGQPVVIYPEGTRAHSNNMSEFKAGSFKVAMRGKLPIVPVCMYDMHKMPYKLRLKPVTIQLGILPTIPYEDYQTLDSSGVAKLVKDMIQSQIDRFDEDKLL